MDMQDVSNLVIPEGEVRTIHDKNSNLLWGKVNYDAKYDGDTLQQTYTGKNLMPILDGVVSVNGITVTASNGVVTINGKSTAAGVIKLSNGLDAQSSIPSSWRDENVIVDRNNTTISIVKKSGTGPSSSSAFRAYRSSSNFDQWYPASGGTTSFTDNYPILFLEIFFNSGITFTDAIYEIQLESGSLATSFEPFVGGIASPNPQFPQSIQVVTGTQTITLSDGVNNHDYTVNLGSIELCKIGTYQDYIYKSGDDWYVHKETSKVILNGSESWGGSNSRYNYSSADVMVQPLTQDAPIVAMSDYLTASNYWAISNNLADNIVSGYYNGGQIRVRVTSFATVTDWKTWLSNHNMTVYYVLATSADTKITDSTLISQLDAVYQFLTRYGYSATVSGNLPIIIDRTAL